MAFRGVLIINKPHIINGVDPDQLIIFIGDKTIQKQWVLINVLLEVFLDRMIKILTGYTLFISKLFL